MEFVQVGDQQQHLIRRNAMALPLGAILHERQGFPRRGKSQDPADLIGEIIAGVLQHPNRALSKDRHVRSRGEELSGEAMSS